MEVEDHLLYTKDHEWVNVEENVATIGITDYAQSSLGDITYIELPPADDEVEQFGNFASIESVKAASDIFSPMSGRVIEVNENLEADPALINKSCYHKGWIAKIEICDMDEASNLMTADEYRSFLESVG
ncbi:MAG TPA: glycine cleavage system protein GcvH [Candidatus Omnitrophica bacterium]|nr:MAG: glycine cleavage system protein H [Omnitrophica WOR_2 bacterium GWA2_45_18]HBR15308.1 glycine cleavage system protein GcvH [Candidatus Omnitrophota bacterium]